VSFNSEYLDVCLIIFPSFKISCIN
jgi:hypothetical protein